MSAEEMHKASLSAWPAHTYFLQSLKRKRQLGSTAPKVLASFDTAYPGQQE